MAPALAGADVLALLAAGAIATAPTIHADQALLAMVALWLPAYLLVARGFGLYSRDVERANHSTVDELGQLFQALTVAVWFFFAAGTLAGFTGVSAGQTVGFWLLAVPLVMVSRATARSLARRSDSYVQRTIIVGAGVVGQALARKLIQHSEYGLQLVGFVDASPLDARGGDEPIKILGAADDLPRLVEEFDVDRVIIAFSGDRHDQILELIRILKDRGICIDVVPRLFEAVPTQTGALSIEGIPIVPLPRGSLSRPSRLLKRSLDLALAIPGLFVLAPLLLATAIAVRLDSKGTIFYRQLRMGANGHIFRIYKFRTMEADADARKAELAHLNKHAREHGDPRMFKIPDDPRVTRVGAFLRRYSIDELPQLINVIKGDMTIVGPRPLILEEDCHVPTWARKRLDLKPGITGIWQVLGNSSIPFEEMIKLDYLYVSSWTLWTDIALMLKTLRVLGGNREFA
jgi:exopolysaccharide biosynthesis polyprenyl glycosylphosphotransferase